jgi:serine/threonine protein phosphatase PrpC
MPPSLRLRSGEHGEQGCRRSMEDASVCLEGVEVEGCAYNPVAFYGIFDGHGGTAAAEFVSTNLVPNITSDPSFLKDPTAAMVRCERRRLVSPRRILFHFQNSTKENKI